MRVRGDGDRFALHDISEFDGGGIYLPAPTTGQAFRIVIGSTTLTGRLFDNETASDLGSQLPLTLTFSDLNDVEKIAPLPRTLSLEGVPPGDDPHVGDLGYWAPSGNLVLYYGDVDYWTGIVRIGEFDETMDTIAGQSGDFQATIESAD